MSKNIGSKICSIRNKRVMLDRDLAALYQVDIRAFHRTLAKNLTRFPKDFMLRLTKKEVKEFGSQYAFTALGVAMTSTVLNNPTATQVNIAIIRVKKLLNELN